MLVTTNIIHLSLASVRIIIAPAQTNRVGESFTNLQQLLGDNQWYKYYQGVFTTTALYSGKLLQGGRKPGCLLSVDIFEQVGTMTILLFKKPV